MGFADYQNEVYFNGLADQTPAFPIGWRELETAAYAAMTPQARGYVGGGAGGEETMRANREAFDRWRILPKMQPLPKAQAKSGGSGGKNPD